MQTDTQALHARPRRRTAVLAAAVLAGLVALTAGSALAARTAGDHMATATLDRLGGDPDAVMTAIADKVVEKVMSEGGTIDEAQQQLVAQLAALAGSKLEGVDASTIVDGVKGEVVAAGLSKLDGISTDAIVEQVTAALVAQASAEIEQLDLQSLAKDVLVGMAKDVDLEKIVAAELAKIDVEKLVVDAIASQMGGGGGTGGSSNWMRLLFR